MIHVVAGGDCRDLPTPAGSALRQQACNLTVQSSSDPQIRGGLMTSNGLVGAGTPLAAANSHIWTVALFAS